MKREFNTAINLNARLPLSLISEKCSRSWPISNLLQEIFPLKAKAVLQATQLLCKMNFVEWRHWSCFSFLWRYDWSSQFKAWIRKKIQAWTGLEALISKILKLCIQQRWSVMPSYLSLQFINIWSFIYSLALLFRLAFPFIYALNLLTGKIPQNCAGNVAWRRHAIPEILCVGNFVNIMQIRQRNEEGMGRGRTALLAARGSRLTTHRSFDRFKNARKRKRLLAV